ncbi:MAG: homoserine O-acetyltransferase [Bacteroidetes bacterium OLB12]|nr:MAG: homoserine O-acetyltransferase [Bacteroidetes bacterium OLB12]HNU42172.1 homoserine O-acetyltransferase [Cyclobacteriaceae bacterium]
MLKVDQIFHFASEFQLETGGKLPAFQLKYTTLGQLNKDRSNVVWICHALTGSSDFTDWWKELFTEDTPFDPREYFIICANTLGGCYGSTGPLSINPVTGKPYYHSFPEITNRDVVRSFDLLRKHLGIESVHTLLGGSLGGQQVLEWAILQPHVFERIIPIATNAFHSPWGIAINEAQRMAIAADASWKEDDARAGVEGMKTARAIGMISFRTYDTFQQTQSEKTDDKTDDFRAASYQRYQGLKLANRFNAFTYWLLTKMMDGHNVGRGKESIEAALATIKAKTWVIGIDTDLLFPIREQEFLARQIPGARLDAITSLHGHDGFLVEFDQFKQSVRKFLRTEVKQEILVR